MTFVYASVWIIALLHFGAHFGEYCDMVSETYDDCGAGMRRAASWSRGVYEDFQYARYLRWCKQRGWR